MVSSAETLPFAREARLFKKKTQVVSRGGLLTNLRNPYHAPKRIRPTARSLKVSIDLRENHQVIYISFLQ